MCRKSDSVTQEIRLCFTVKYYMWKHVCKAFYRVLVSTVHAIQYMSMCVLCELTCTVWGCNGRNFIFPTMARSWPTLLCLWIADHDILNLIKPSYSSSVNQPYQHNQLKQQILVNQREAAELGLYHLRKKGMQLCPVPSCWLRKCGLDTRLTLWCCCPQNDKKQIHNTDWVQNYH